MEKSRRCRVEDLEAWMPRQLFEKLLGCKGMPGARVGGAVFCSGPGQLMFLMRPWTTIAADSLPSEYHVAIELREYGKALPDNWDVEPDEWRLGKV